MATEHPYTLFVQPVYRRDSSRLSLWGHEVLVRSVRGETIRTPREIFDTFTGREDWWQLDLAVLNLCTRRPNFASSPYALCLNVSSPTLESALFRRQYLRALKNLAERRRPMSTVLEFPEDLSLAQDDLSLVIEELRDAGIRCALDDFGKANSNAARLRSHRWDYCKVDWTVRNRERIDLGDATRLCQTLKIEAIIEGVETTADLASLAGLPLSGMQGFLLHEPYFPSSAHLWTTGHATSSENPPRLRRDAH